MNTQSETTQEKNAKRVINLIIVDESGSMAAIEKQAVEGMNTTIEKIKADANAVEGARQYVNLITFDSSHYTQHLRHCPAEEARTLRHGEYRPGGCTPLYDAIGRAVTTLERHITDNDIVLVTIITDGEENASTEYGMNEIKRLISRLSEKGWLFTYIGANQDAMYEAGKIGIYHNLNFKATAEETPEMFDILDKSRHSFYGRINLRMKKGKTIKEALFDEEDCDFFED